MSGGPWRARELLGRVPLDRPGWEVRVYRKTWPDGSACIDLQKWVQRPDGSWSFYRPAQYLQVPIEAAGRVLAAVGEIGGGPA